MKIAYITGRNPKIYHDALYAGIKTRWSADRFARFADISSPEDFDCIFIEGTGESAIEASKKEYPNLMIRTSGVEVYESNLHHINWTNVKWFLAYSQHQIDYFKSYWGSRPTCEAKNYGILHPVALLDRFRIQKRPPEDNAVALVANITGRKGITQIPQFLLEYPDLHVYHLGKICKYGNPPMDFVRWRTQRDGTADRYHYLKIINGGQMPGWYQGKKYLWLPSIQEGFSRSISEGMCSGLKPIIRHWAGAETLWPTDHLYDTLDEIQEILDLPYEPKKYRAFVEERYSLGNILNKLEQFLKA